ncbi:MAG TPA: potassium transporter TrkG [Pirellulales bacterium]|nr:potassium transporter TrkG [Pirellulales bacterium]
MVRVSGSLVQYPARAAVVWYAGLIAIGALVLRLPQAVVPGTKPLSTIDALFTATSASCVTGLAVRSTGRELSRLGQAAVLVLIQVGGIGIMTITTFVVLRLGGRESLRHRVLLTQTLGSAERDLRIMIWKILRLVAVCEGAGCLLLALPAFSDSGGDLADGLWTALFHSISAFCNAGFALHDSSLAPQRANVLVNLTVMALIVTGGIGFPVIRDVSGALRGGNLRPWESLSMHSKMMLIGTASLLAGGAALFLFLEWNNVLTDMPLGEKLLVACFQSTTTRTAGFETVPMAHLTNATLFGFMLLMLIGGGPGSTAGGFKVSTFMVLVCHAWAKLRGRRGVNFFRRSVGQETLDAAMAAALLFATVAASALVIFLVIEQADAPHHSRADAFLDAAFEVCSALGTVGLSTGITPGLSSGAKAVLIVLMFLGRLGPISAFVALARSDRRERIEYAKEDVLIG